MITLDLLRRGAPRCPAEWLQPLNDALAEWLQPLTPARQAEFLAQICAETSEFQRLEENLSYSAQALQVTWPAHFPTPESASPYARNPEPLANLVYADRYGNGDAASGDGWRYRGRGCLMTTFKYNYQQLEKEMNLPLVANPDLLLQPFAALKAAGLFWSEHHLNALADAGDTPAITKIVNGGLNGLARRQAYALTFRKLLGETP